MTNLIGLINNSAIIMVAAATWVVVWALKQSKLSNLHMPIYALLIGVVIGVIVGELKPELGLLNGAFDGLIAGGFAVGGNEMLKSITDFISKED